MATPADETQMIDKYLQLTRFLVESMMPEEPAEVAEVEARVDRGQLKLTLRVPEKYRGRIIGRGGQNIRALRQVIEGSDMELPYRISLDILR